MKHIDIHFEYQFVNEDESKKDDSLLKRELLALISDFRKKKVEDGYSFTTRSIEYEINNNGEKEGTDSY